MRERGMGSAKKVRKFLGGEILDRMGGVDRKFDGEFECELA